MVAIVSGNSLGLSLTSFATLGQRGVIGTAGQGRSGEQAFVNIATGNLILQDLDDRMQGRGLDIVTVRTYNSQGLLDDDNADNWAVGAFGQRVQLSGTVGTPGSTLTRTDRDGAQAVYTWDAASSCYVSMAGSGAMDTIACDATAAQFVWTDGDTGFIERYQSTGQGRLLSASDSAGNTVTYAYNANGTVESVTSANGETTWYDYAGTNLSRIRTVDAHGVTLTAVHYTYDSSNRLATVKVDLTPEDNSIADGKVYLTTYTYDGASRRIASVTQSDGTRLAFTYVQVGSDYKVRSVTDALGAVTTFDYDTAAGTTTVTDPLGAQSVYHYDAEGRLVQVRQGVTATNPAGLSQVSYAYDAAGNLALLTDGEGNRVLYEYDERGNLLKEIDAAGNTRVRTYGAQNQLLTDTAYADAAVNRGAFSKEAALPETVRYVYANGNPLQLRFVISAQGNVTEYRYDAYGLRESAIEYAGAAYAQGIDLPSEAQMATWCRAQDLTRTQRTDYAFDGRGELSATLTYASVAADGRGNPVGAAATYYVYDSHGRLIQKIEAGADGGTTDYIYDGLGRVIATIAPPLDGSNVRSLVSTQYDDAGGKTAVILANGLSTISAYDRAGRLVSVSQSGVGAGILGTTTYAYDSNGNLLMTEDPTGARQWFLYDEAHRKIADIDATGALTEYVHNANGQLRQTIAYATPANTDMLVDAAGRPTAPGLDAMRPVDSAKDQKVWRFYDSANRLTWQVDALGYVTQTTYDGASRVLSVTQLAHPIDVSKLGNGANIELLVDPAMIGGITLSVSGGSSALGSTVTLTATVAGTASGGMVTFFNGDTIIGSAMVVNGKATLQTTELQLGVNNIRAAYSGDANRPASVSPLAQRTVTGAVTSAALSFSPGATISVGEAVTLSAALTTAQPPGLAPASGEVKFYNGGTLIGTATVINGLAMLTTSALPAGTPTLNIRAEYTGDERHAGTVSAQQVPVMQSATRTELKISDDSGGALTLTATVSPITMPFFVPPSGKVSFYDGNTLVGSASLVDGRASLQIDRPNGAAALRAVYEGDAAYTTSNTARQTTTVMSASATSVTQGEPVTLTAQVFGAAPGGLVTFFAGTQILGTAQVVDGRATLVTNYLPVGENVVLSAAYAGDANNLGSVQAHGPAIRVAAGASTIAPPTVQQGGVGFDESASTAGYPKQVIAQVSGAGAPTGTFSIFDGETLIGCFVSGSTNPANVQFYWPDMSVGAHDITIVYSGDAARSAAISAAKKHIVGRIPATLGLSSSNPQVTVGSSLTLTAKLAIPPLTWWGDVFSGPAASGSVSFYNNGVLIGTAEVISGIATLAVDGLTLGTGTFTARYAGDDNYQAAASGTLTQQVLASPQSVASTTTLSVADPSGGRGTSVTLTATVTTGAASLGAPAGTVSFYKGNQFLGTAAVVNGLATLHIEQLPLGTEDLRAVYSGEANNATSATSLASSVVEDLTLSASATSVTQGDPVTLTAQMGGAAAGAVVTFFAGTQFLGTAEVIDGRATFVASYLPVGANVVITASLAGVTNNTGDRIAQSPAIRVAAGMQNPAPPEVDQDALEVRTHGGIPDAGFVSLWVAFPLGPRGECIDTGTFSVFDGQTLIGSFFNQWPGTILLPGLAPGSHDLTVVYSGDASNPSSMRQLKVVVDPTPSKVALETLPLWQFGANAPVTLTARISPDYTKHVGSPFTGPVAGGTVTFSSNGVILGTADVINGVATLKLDGLPAGTANLVVSYSGDAYYAATTLDQVRQVSATLPAGSFKLVSSPATAPYGLPVTLTATGVGPGGTYSFYDGTTLLGTVALVDGQATLVVHNLEIGPHIFNGAYSGDASYGPSTTKSGITVVQFPSVLTNQTAASISKDGALSVRIGGVDPSGMVSFYEGFRLLGTAEVINGMATLSGVALPAGTRSITAAYTGDAHNTDAEVTFTQVIEGEPLVYLGLDITQDRIVTQLYDRDGRLLGVLDGEGYLTEYKYNAAGDLIQTVRYANRAANFADIPARLAAVATARASYDLVGLRPSANISADIRTYNFYDAQGRLVGHVDGEGYLTETTYDLRGNVVETLRYVNKAVNPGTATTLSAVRPTVTTHQSVTQNWSAANQLLTRTNAEGTLTRYVYDNVGLLIQSTTAAGTVDERTQRFLRDLQGRLIGELDGRGSDAVAMGDPFAMWAEHGLTHTYDAAGRRTSSTDANGHRTLFFYDAVGRLAFTVNAMGEVTESRYSAQGQLSEQVIYGTRVDVTTLGATTPGGLNTARLASMLAEVADPTRDTHVLYEYNATGTLASTTDALGHVTAYSYNAFREATAQTYTLASGAVVTDTASYDRRGLKTASVRDAEGLALTERNTYDAFGRVTDCYDGNNNRTRFSYDRLGRIVTTFDALNAYRYTTYDAFDRVLTLRDALSYTTYDYDTAGRSVTVTTPEGVSVSTVHNAHGQTISVIDGRGNITAYSYDKSGNLVRTDTALTTERAVYDKTGLLLESTDANGVVTAYTYDAASRLLTRTLDAQDGGLKRVTTYGYDAKGQTVSVTDPNGTVTAIDFDLAGQVLSQTVDPTGLNLQTRYDHDTTGRILRVTAPNGSVTQYTYDAAGRRVMEQVDPEGLDLTRRYEYDDAGNVTRVIDANGNATRYAYDANNRLVFTLDPLGNVTQQIYDAEGRVVRRTSYAASIDIAGLTDKPTVAQIQARVRATAGMDLSESYRYDRDGRLRFSVDGTGAVVEYKYDKANNVVETRAYANRIDLANWNLASDPAVVADANRDQRVRTVYDQLDRAIWRVDGAGGVVQTTYDANGNVVETRAYANPLSASAFNSWNGQSAPAVVPDEARDLRIRTVYDSANRATWTVDGIGGVACASYDANGNLIETRRYANVLDATTLAAWDGKTTPAAIADDSRDARLRTVYDAANRATWSVDGAGSVQSTAYDANGNITGRRQYATLIAYDADPQGVPPGTSDRVTDYLYDGANRLVYQLRYTNTSNVFAGMGEMRDVISYDYDGVGRLVRQTAHAHPLLGYVPNSLDAIRANLTVAPGLDQTRYNVYDAAGRLTWSVDGVGAVTRNDYDGTGRVVRTTQYANAVDVLGFGGAWNGYQIPQLSDSALQALLRPDAAVDRTTLMAHDGAGRATFAVDALGGVSRTVYDAFGNVTQRIGYAKPIAAPQADQADRAYTDEQLKAIVATTADATADRIQRIAYDQANRQVFVVDAVGAATEIVYDAIGQVTETRQYARVIETSGLSATAAPADIGARIAADAANDRISRQTYDAAGRAQYSVDPLGYVTLASYDGLGQVLATTQYALAIPATTANTAAAVAAAVRPHPGDRTQARTYDAAGHVLTSTDAMGFTESWTYNSLGEKTTYTNANGAVWRYAYDRAGRMVLEVAPEVELTAVTPGEDGRLQVDEANSGLGSVVTTMTYDAFGNLASRTEAAGRPEERTTRYVYDALGRQVKVIYPPVGVYDPAAEDITTNGASGEAVRVDSVQTLYTETTYDALGNAVANRDVGGNYSYKTYDLVGCLAFDVDALGYVTGYTRNAFGDVTDLTRFGAASGLADGQPASLATEQVRAVVQALDRTHNRTISNQYDRLGRVIQVTEANVLIYDASLGSDYGAKTTRNTYDAFGNLVQVAELRENSKVWGLSAYYFDKRGQQIASVDALGYLTTQSFDGAGNLVGRMEYANAVDGHQGTGTLAGWTGLATAGGTPPVARESRRSDGGTDDRQTAITYDTNNHKIAEKRIQVEFSTASDGSKTHGDLTTTYGYDAVGNLTSTTDAAGGTTYSYYDALGRVTAVVEPVRYSTENGAAIAPLTVFKRDAYGNVVVKTEYVNGASMAPGLEGTPAESRPASSVTPILVDNPEYLSRKADNQYAEDLSPGYISLTPFEGSVPLRRLYRPGVPPQHIYTTSAAEYDRLNEGGLWTGEGITGYVAATQVEGTQPLIRMVSSYGYWTLASPAQALQLVLASVGSIGQWSYDLGAGPGGVVGYVATGPTDQLDTELVHMFDLPDNLFLTRTIVQQPSLEAVLQTDRVTYAQYDSHGHVVQSTDAAGVNHNSAYNAQGLVAKEWQQVTNDADGNAQTLYRAYQYDALGRQTHVIEPGDGSAGSIVDTELRYNAFGELSAKLVNGEQGEYFDYDNAGRLWRTNAGDGVDKIALYDQQGNQTAEISSAGQGRGDADLSEFGSAEEAARRGDLRRTDTTYDLLGRVTSQTLAERRETQGGLDVRNDTLSGDVTASAGLVNAAWSGSNTVHLGWDSLLAGLGSGEVKVRIQYVASDRAGNDVIVDTWQTFTSAQAASGVDFTWTDKPDGEAGGVRRVLGVTIQKKDQFGNDQTLVDNAGFGPLGQSVYIAPPDAAVGPAPGSAYPGAQVQLLLRYADAPADTGWFQVPLTHFGDGLRFDASGLDLERSYEYRVVTLVPGQKEQTTASGQLGITPRPLVTIGSPIGIDPAGQNLQWQGPGGADTQVIRLRAIGSDAWIEQPIQRPHGETNPASLIDLAGLASGRYEYELLWSRPGESGPYAHATGEIDKVGGTPPTTGFTEVPNPEVASAAGMGWNQIPFDAYISGVPFAGSVPLYRLELNGLRTLHIYTTSENESLLLQMSGWRVEGITGYVSATQTEGTEPLYRMQRDKDGLFALVNDPAEVMLLMANGWTPAIVVGYVPKAPTGDMNVQLVRMVSYAAADNFYLAGSLTQTYTIPGTPAQYDSAPTDLGPYPVSQDKWLGGRIISQSAIVQGADGYQRPVVNQNVDRWGNVVSISDPRSAAWVTTYRYNANNQLIEQVLADGASTQITYDQLGRQVAVRDANGHVNGQEWDAGGKLVRELHADGGVVAHAYDAFGNRVLTIDAENHPTWYLHDKLNRLIQTTYANGIRENQRWDEAGRLVSTTNGEGETIRYAYDLRGNLVRATLPMGQTTEYAYDALNRKIRETDANGNTATWSYDYFGALTGHTDIGGATYSYSYDSARQLIAMSNDRGQNQRFSYDAAGQLMRIQDDAVGRTTTYRYDLAGRHIRETTVQGGETYQDNHIAYDALGRMRWVADGRVALTIDYDNVGNRTHVHTFVNDGNLVNRTSDSDYEYDAMNRQTKADGHTMEYDKNGNRIKDTSADGVETYDYDQLNRLWLTKHNGALVEERTYDNAHRVVRTDTPAGYRTNIYNDNGLLEHQDIVEPGSNWSGVNYDYDDVGNLKSTLVADLVSQTFSRSINEYAPAGDGYQLKSSKNVLQTLGELIYNYDANGHLESTNNVYELNSANRDHLFINDAAGNVLHTYYLDSTTKQPVNAQRQLVVNGEVLGRYGETATSRMTLGALGYPNWTHVNYEAQADFSFGAQGINNQYPAGTPGSRVVQDGDTLRGIAQATYGNGALWYVIAEANGLSSDADLVTGHVLKLPPVVDSANNVDTFRPYDPSRIASDTPTGLPIPQGKDGGCGAVGQIIVVVIAVVVTIYTAGVASAYFGAAGASTASLGATMTSGIAALSGSAGAAGVAGAVVGGAAGSVVSQGVGVAIGTQDSFSWKQVALSAVGAGVTAGVGSYLGPVTSQGFDKVMAYAGRAALTNTITQGVGVAMGSQSSFSWKSVAASAVSAGAAQGLNAAMGYNPVNGFDLGKSLATGIGGSVIGQVVRGGKVSAATVATDAFGNVLGDSLAWANSSVNPSSRNYENQMDRGAFAPGSGYTSSQSVTLYDGSTISPAENLRRINLSRGSAYASNDIGEPSQRVMSDAGGTSGVDGGDYDYERTYWGSDGVYTVEASRSPFDANAAESANPGSLTEFLNPSGQAPYNPNWQADLVRSTLANAMAQRTDRNTPSARALDSRDSARIAQQQAVRNYVNGQGSMALGGVAASISMVASRNLQTASMVTDLAAPIDSLIAPMGGGGRAAMASARGNGAASAAVNAERAYLNQKFGRTGTLDVDINARGALDPRREIDRLVAEGHAVGRHGERVSESALNNRALYKQDPITGTTTDYFTRGTHNVGRNATQFKSNESLLRADAYVRGSPQFAAEEALAISAGRPQFAVKGLMLEDAFGPNYASQVFGTTRVGSVNTGTTIPIDFTGGTITGVFRRSTSGGWNLHTMYPEPK